MASTPPPFIFVSDLSNHLGRDLSADMGAVMAVDAACDVIRDITEQDFNQATTTEAFDGTGTDSIVLPQAPLLNVGTVVVNSGTITDYTFSKQTNALIRGTADSRWPGAPLPVWPAGRQNVRVTYDHGYSVAGTVSDVPRSIKMVALMIAERLVVQGVAQSETVGDVTVDYGQAASDLTKTEQGLLYGYLRTRSF